MTTLHPRAAARADETPQVIVVGAGPVGCAAALLLADRGIPVTLLERHTRPHPLPRAVHLDDEVARTLHRLGISEAFLAGARPGSGLRLLDARHRVMGEFRRELEAGDNGFPAANMFHQPDLEALLFERVDRHPLISFHRGVEVHAIDGVHDPLPGDPVRVHASLVTDASTRTFTGTLLLGCDGANSTIRQLLGVPMEDLRFTEQWLVVDVRAADPLDTWDGVEQVCDPARAATFMHVTGDRYRWEFQLRDGETEADLIKPEALGQLLQPWTGRHDLDGLDIVRSTTYTFRARLATRFQVGRSFLLGDAAHLTPPFIGQGLGVGMRDADNLAWKIAHVLAGADQDLLATYQTERRPHAKALIRKAVLVGWAMTGGQDRAATVRKLALGGIMRSPRVQQLVGSTVTPRLRTGALHRTHALSGVPRQLRPGTLIPNPMCSTTGSEARLDDVLCGQTALLTGRCPEPHLLDACRAQGILAVQVVGEAPTGSVTPADAEWLVARLTGSGGGLGALIENPTLTVLVRPDRVIAAVTTRSRVPRLPWAAPTTNHTENTTN